MHCSDGSIRNFIFLCRDQKYEMDPKDLEAKYKMLMKKLHPDLFHGKSKVFHFPLILYERFCTCFGCVLLESRHWSPVCVGRDGELCSTISTRNQSVWWAFVSRLKSYIFGTYSLCFFVCVCLCVWVGVSLFFRKSMFVLKQHDNTRSHTISIT